MKDKDLYKLAAVIISLLVLLIISAFFLSQRSLEGKKIISKNMEIKSSAFENNQPIPKKYTCDGENINPPLIIENVPGDAKSLLLIVDDPDAPGGTWNHWIVWNIEPSNTFIEESSVPEGAFQGQNDAGNNSYYGPCPPTGNHRYHFKVFALNKFLEADSSLEKERIETLIEGNILDSAELIGTYEREQ
jgi:Raf kinase inhibitor-like YbhB/YbcL family protein